METNVFETEQYLRLIGEKLNENEFVIPLSSERIAKKLLSDRDPKVWLFAFSELEWAERRRVYEEVLKRKLETYDEGMRLLNTLDEFANTITRDDYLRGSLKKEMKSDIEKRIDETIKKFILVPLSRDINKLDYIYQRAVVGDRATEDSRYLYVRYDTSELNSLPWFVKNSSAGKYVIEIAKEIKEKLNLNPVIDVRFGLFKTSDPGKPDEDGYVNLSEIIGCSPLDYFIHSIPNDICYPNDREKGEPQQIEKKIPLDVKDVQITLPLINNESLILQEGGSYFIEPDGSITNCNNYFQESEEKPKSEMQYYKELYTDAEIIAALTMPFLTLRKELPQTVLYTPRMVQKALEKCKSERI